MKKLFLVGGGTGGHCIPINVVYSEAPENFKCFILTDNRGKKYFDNIDSNNVIIFRNVENLELDQKIDLYGSVYIYALIIPIVSILGVVLANYLRAQKIKELSSKGLEFKEERGEEKTKVNWWILGGSLIFVIFTLSLIHI